MLVPTLRPGDIIIIDNLGSHKVSGAAIARRTIGRRCCGDHRVRSGD